MAGGHKIRSDGEASRPVSSERACVSEAAVCARACEVQADSDEDPDLWLWESLYFKHIAKREMKG